ncbi:MAG TPA: response regulator, partial [Flavitalea sp.]|nr:response regulator [Flavitalea sp.]
MNGSILIIDDEQQLRKLLFRLISLEGFEVQQTADLKSAAAILKHHPVQVILCDVKLPDGNGIDFVSV